MNIVQKPSPNWSGTLTPKAIMLHHTVSTNWANTVAYMQRPTSRVSSHFCVGKQGEVAQLVRIDKRAWHAGLGSGVPRLGIPANTGNTYCIGIEMVNLGNGTDPYTPAQLKALDDLIAHIDRTLGKQLPITDHKEYAPGRKSDMAGNFPLAAYRANRRHGASADNRPVLTRYLRLTKPMQNGEDVRNLQRILAIGTDGWFGSITDTALRAWQRKVGLVADGVVGPASAAKLGWEWRG